MIARVEPIQQALSRRRLLASAAGSAAVIAGGGLGADPARASTPLKIICPFTSGSGADVIARHFAERLGDSLKRPVIVDNRTGGNGVIAVQAIKSQPPDGSTILLGNVSIMSINPVLYKNLGYQPAKDFLPLSGVYRGYSVFAVHPDSRIGSIDQLIARAKQGPLTVGSYSPGYRLAAEYLASLANVKFTDVPYRGQAPLIADLMGGQMDAAVLEYGGAIPAIQAGRVRALAITSERRHSQLPDLPTVKELGYPDYYHYGWTAFFAHPQTAAATAQVLSAAISSTLRDPRTIEYIHRTVFGEPMPLTSEELATFIQTETDRFAKVARAAGMEPT